MQLFNMLEGVLSYLQPDEIEQVRRAFLMAEKAHDGQFRASGEPYIVHPVAVARILATMHLDYKSLIVALLHDVIEDTEYSKEDIQTTFDEEIASLVDGVTKLTQIKFNTRAEAQAENFRKMLLAMTKDVRTIIIKLADRMHNMQTVQHLNFERRRRIARETLDIYAPLARRLGMHHFSLELENYAFSVMHPLRYRVLADAMKKVQGDHHDILEEIKLAVQGKLENNQVGLITIEAREKHLYSIYRKMRNKHIPFNEIMDVYAFRIVVDDPQACYQVLGLVHSLFKPVPERFKDYVAIPKANGYQSLHTTLFGPYGLPIEVQIRTTDMDHLAISGIAAHWVYKSEKERIEQSQLRAQKWVKNLLELQQSSGDSLEFIESVKVDLFPDEVYLFTPKGKIVELPAGATAIDFAYAVHTDIGNSCVAVKIDRQLAALSSGLINGQTIEVITSSRGRPNPAWLDFVATSKARSGIRHYLKNQQKSEAIVLGRQLLEKALGALGLKLNKIPEPAMKFVLQFTSL